MSRENEKPAGLDAEKPDKNSQDPEITKKQSFNNDSASMIPGNKHNEEEQEKSNGDSPENKE